MNAQNRCARRCQAGISSNLAGLPVPIIRPSGAHVTLILILNKQTHAQHAWNSPMSLSFAPRASSGSRPGSPPASAAGSACRSHTRPGSRCSADLQHVIAASGRRYQDGTKYRADATLRLRYCMARQAQHLRAHGICLIARGFASFGLSMANHRPNPAGALRKVLNSSACSARRGLSTFSRYVLCSPVTACWTHLSMSRLPPSRECLVQRHT